MNYCRLMGELPLSNNTSTERGWLTPTSGDPDYDKALEDLLHQWMSNVAGLPVKLVRPRWQKDQPSLPPVETNWCAFGIVDWSTDDNPAFTRQTEDSTELWRHEVFLAMASFYGPAGMQYAAIFRDGVMVEQNNTELNRLGLSLGSMSDITPFPELINNQWVRRYDLRVQLRRKVVRTYNIKSVVDPNVTIVTGD